MTTTLSHIGLHEARELALTLEPTASVYLGRAAHDGTAGLTLRLRAIACRLREQGASQDTIDAVLGYLAGLPDDAHEYAVFARGGEVVSAHHLPGAVRADLALYATPAKLAPLLAWLQRHPAYVRVVAGRDGADLLTVPAGSFRGMSRTVLTPLDDRSPGHRGPWSRRAEFSTWHRGAEAVAVAVEEEIDRVKADLVLVAGDSRAILLLTEDLRIMGRTCAIRRLPATRGSAADHPLATIEAIRDYSADLTAALLQQLEDERGYHGRALEGRAAVLSALADGAVSTLLIVKGVADHRAAWFGPDVLCAAAPLPVARSSLLMQRGELSDVAIRAALLTRANVSIVSACQGALIEEGIAALRRT